MPTSKKNRLLAWTAPAVLAATLAAAGCEQKSLYVEEASSDIRPVRTVVVGDGATTRSTTFSGVVRARHESRLGFRTAGQVTERLVEVGERVTAGQPLLRIDAQDANLNLLANEAQEEAARSRLAQAEADLARSEALHDRDITADAALERDRLAVSEAEEAFRSAQAQSELARNQRDYATLAADRDGVVTALLVEAGQVVSAGQVAIEVAADGEREVEISVPESRVAEIRDAEAIRVALWSDPLNSYGGSLRELAPDTDDQTRTYAARVTVEDADDAVWLGLSASVEIATAADEGLPQLPLSAVMSRPEGARVWVVEPAGWTVSAREVVVSAAIGELAVIADGLADGEIVVTAGAHLLHEGQQVRPLATAAGPAMAQAEGARS